MQQAVIFVRVSKKEQDYQRQVEDLRAVAQSQAVQVVAEIAEKISGARRNQEREGIQQLLELSRQGAIQKVLVSEVSRLGRSTVEVLQIERFLSPCILFQGIFRDESLLPRFARTCRCGVCGARGQNL